MVIKEVGVVNWMYLLKEYCNDYKAMRQLTNCGCSPKTYGEAIQGKHRKKKKRTKANRH